MSWQFYCEGFDACLPWSTRRGPIERLTGGNAISVGPEPPQKVPLEVRPVDVVHADLALRHQLPVGLASDVHLPQLL